MPRASSYKSYLAKRRAAGLCTRCPGKTDTTGDVCKACLAKKRASRASNKRVATTPRHCLRCDRSFLSEGPYHRLCTTCREYIEHNPTPVEEYGVRRSPKKGRAP